MSIVTGRIVIPSKAPTVRATRTVVRVRDVTRCGSLAAPVAEIRMVVDVAPDKEIRFSIDVPDDKRSDKIRLNLEVHVDLDGSGHFSPGDLVSMKPCRVLPGTRDLDVPVSMV